MKQQFSLSDLDRDIQKVASDCADVQRVLSEIKKGKPVICVPMGKYEDRDLINLFNVAYGVNPLFIIMKQETLEKIKKSNYIQGVVCNSEEESSDDFSTMFGVKVTEHEVAPEDGVLLYIESPIKAVRKGYK